MKIDATKVALGAVIGAVGVAAAVMGADAAGLFTDDKLAAEGGKFFAENALNVPLEDAFFKNPSALEAFSDGYTHVMEARNAVASAVVNTTGNVISDALGTVLDTPVDLGATAPGAVADASKLLIDASQVDLVHSGVRDASQAMAEKGINLAKELENGDFVRMAYADGADLFLHGERAIPHIDQVLGAHADNANAVKSLTALKDFIAGPGIEIPLREAGMGAAGGALLGALMGENSNHPQYSAQQQAQQSSADYWQARVGGSVSAQPQRPWAERAQPQTGVPGAPSRSS